MSAAATKSRAIWALLISLSLLAVLAIAGVAALFALQHRLDAAIARFDDPFVGLGSDRPPAPSSTGADAAEGTPVNILMLGSDSRISAGDPSDWDFGAQRTDAIMIASISGDRESVTIMSIPRDSWVPVDGYGDAKINAAYSFGGPPLMVHTVEQLTGIRIDHVVVTDFESFQHITDELGGVKITLSQPLDAGGETLQAGEHLLSGEQALAYTRQRHGLSGGDFSRIQRQQNWMRATMTTAFDRDVFTRPLDLADLLTVVSENIAVDEGFSIGDMRTLALSLRNLSRGNVQFVTAPVLGTGWSPDGRQSIVELDPEALDDLCRAIAEDRAAAYVSDHPDLVRLGSSVE